jgi:hypothetical protein
MSLPLDLVQLSSHSTCVSIEKTIPDVLEIRNLDANKIVAVTSDAALTARRSFGHARLEKAERECGIDRPKKLKQSIENKWESQFDMVERFLQIQKYVNIALVEGGHAYAKHFVQMK